MSRYAGMAEAVIGPDAIRQSLYMVVFTTRTCECGYAMSAASRVGILEHDAEHRLRCQLPIVTAETWVK